MCNGNGTNLDILVNNQQAELEKHGCCVCEDKDDIISNNYTKCPSDHNICKTCYLSVLQICYCKNSIGEVLYRCPLCRNDHMISNTTMNTILLELTGVSELCLKVHKLCENKNITKKCHFEKCGCRVNIVDIYTKNDLDLAIKDIIYLANNYSKKNEGKKSPRNKIQKRN
jgi:hypothetical protein